MEDKLLNTEHGRLVVEALAYRKKVGKQTRRFYLCRCKCGGTKIVQACILQSKKCHSCGCLRKRRGKDNPKWTGVGEISGSYWDSVVAKAKKRGRGGRLSWPVEIDAEYAWLVYQRQGGVCALSGTPIGFGKERTASLDRIDSGQGYLPGNVQWVHKTVNLMKQNLPESLFIEFCLAIAAHQGAKNVRK